MNIDKVTRVEVIHHTSRHDLSGRYGRVYTFWNEYHKYDTPNPKVELFLQDGGRTLKIFITDRVKSKLHD